MEHGLFAESRCLTCEDEFVHRHLKAKAVAATVAATVFSSLMGVLAGTGALWKVLAIPYSGWGLALAAFTILTVSLWTTRQVVRRAFLREQVPAPRLEHAGA